MAWMYAWGKGRGDLGWRARDAPELAHAEETTPRSNFVTEAETNLSGRERHLLAVEVQKALKVYKEALRGLWPEVANRCALRTDLRLEHKVEVERFTELMAVLALDAKSLEKRMHLV